MKLVVAGATSAIACAVMREAVEAGDSLYLIARNAQKLDAVMADLRVRGGTVEGVVADLDDVSGHQALLDQAHRATGGFDALLVAHGVLTDQRQAQADPAVFARDVVTNFVSAASLAEAAARVLEPRRAGVIGVITSVAGDRGRQSNYAYGSAKAGLSAYLSGLRNRLSASNVAVVDLKVGMVDTPMTAHLPKGPLFASPATVGRGIHRALVRRRDVVYVPLFWAGVMCVIRNIPERLFKKLKL